MDFDLTEEQKMLQTTVRDFAEKEIADIFIDLGFYIGMGAPISYPKNDWLRQVIKDTDLSSLLLETDAPFLPPQQYRGKRNYPKYLPLIAEVIAKIKGVDVETVGKITTQNACNLFRFAHKTSDLY